MCLRQFSASSFRAASLGQRDFSGPRSRANSRMASSARRARAEPRSLRQAWLQVFTSSQQSAHFLRQENRRPQCRQIFSGRGGFMHSRIYQHLNISRKKLPLLIRKAYTNFLFYCNRRKNTWRCAPSPLPTGRLWKKSGPGAIPCARIGKPRPRRFRSIGTNSLSRTRVAAGALWMETG